jgi:hypothetical protein
MVQPEDVQPEDTVATAAERLMLETWLDVHRDTVVTKIDGLSEVDIRRRLVPSLGVHRPAR